jgi:glycosyltransferase involved in cell wall biosynthesis
MPKPFAASHDEQWRGHSCLPRPNSSGRPRALLLAPESPYPVIGGGPLRTASLLAYLSAKYDVDVIVFREPGSPDPRETFPPGLVKELCVIDLRYHSKSTTARAFRNLDRLIRRAPPLIDRFSGYQEFVRRFLENRSYALGVVEHFWCAPYVDLLKPCCEMLLLDLHNIESQLLARCAVSEGWSARTALRRFSESCRKLEQELIHRFSAVLTPSEQDLAEIHKISAGVRGIVYPNTIPTVSPPSSQKRNEIVFSGNLEYHPNISAVHFFSDCIWPRLRARWPELCWRIVGRNSERFQRRFARDDSILVTGPVDNAVNAIAEARVAVAPLLAGSGTRVKIIEAWAAGVPVVSTSIGAEGLPGRAGEHLLIADTPAAFFEAVSRILADAGLERQLGSAGRRLYETHLTWEAGWARLDEFGL